MFSWIAIIQATWAAEPPPSFPVPDAQECAAWSNTVEETTSTADSGSLGGNVGPFGASIGGGNKAATTKRYAEVGDMDQRAKIQTLCERYRIHPLDPGARTAYYNELLRIGALSQPKKSAPAHLIDCSEKLSLTDSSGGHISFAKIGQPYKTTSEVGFRAAWNGVGGTREIVFGPGATYVSLKLWEPELVTTWLIIQEEVLVPEFQLWEFIEDPKRLETDDICRLAADAFQARVVLRYPHNRVLLRAQAP